MAVTPPPYLPFCDPIKARIPGLFPLQSEDWTQRDSAFDQQVAYRDHLVANNPDVAIALPESETALSELMDLLTGHLAGNAGYVSSDGAITRPDGVTISTAPDIQSIARLSQEDWVVLQDLGGPEVTLTAGALCFPAHWSLPAKIGRALTTVHGPVPQYALSTAPRVNRIFKALHPDRPLQRLNWSIASSPELHTPTPHQIRPDEVPRYLRVERQTLVRLPETRAVVFGIKTYMTPLDDLAADARTALRRSISGLSPEMRSYKGGSAYLDRV